MSVPGWVLRPIKRNLNDTLAGHVFWSEEEAQRWLGQEYVRGKYKVTKHSMRRVRCGCGRTRWVRIALAKA